MDHEDFLRDIRERLLQAVDYMTNKHNKSHRNLTFDVGEWAWLRL